MNTRHKHVFVYFKLLFLIGLFTNLVWTQGMPPTANTPGSPAGSYKLSDLDTINLFNGNLSLDVPLINVGGRGEVAQGLSVNIENQWVVEAHHTIGDLISFEINPSYRSPLALVGHITSESAPPTTLNHMPCGGPYELVYYVQHQFNLKYVEPDGTEHMLVDPMYRGKPYLVCTPFYNYGRVFESTSAEFMTFVTDADISSSSMTYSGYLYRPGGVKSRIVNGQVIWSEDRNGNKIQYTYNTGQYDSRLNTISDSNGRSVTIEYGVTDAAPYGVCDRITFKGGSGQNRIFRIKSDYLNNILRTTQSYDSSTLKTIAQLFPTENISYSLSNPNQELNVWRVKSVFLPDGRSYDFQYNVYGRLARVELPTGGATEYDYGAPFYTANLEYHEGIVVGVGQEFVDHRVNEKRIYDGNNSLVSKATFVKATSCPPQEPICPLSVDVDNYDASGNRINKAKHYFYGWPNGLRSYETHWTNGREFKTEAYAVDGTTLLRKTEMNWVQRIPTWCYNNPYVPNICGPNPSVGMPAHNSFVAETTTTLADSNQVSRTSSINPNTGEIGFDQYNNQTDFYEYDFGIGAPGALLRRIHTDFVIHPDYLNGQLFSLPSQTWVSSDINGTTKASLTQFEYDNYNPDANHAGLVARSSVVGHDTTNYGTSKTNRGNVTKVTTYENAQTQTGAVSAYSQYDILGNVVKTIDAKGNASTIDYADRFGAPDDEVLSNTPPAHLNGQSTFAFPTAVTNPPAVTNQLGWTAYAQFDYFTGQPVNAEDINGVIAKTIYNDLLDRPTQSVTAVGTTFERQANIIYDDANRRIETKTDLNALNDNLLKSESFYDGLGRTFEARKYESNGDYVATKTEYDALGRPKRATNPYRPQQNETIYWTESFYDALSRVTKIKTPDNAEVLTAYSGNSVTVTDQAGKQRRSVTNALGQLIRVDEPDAIGNLGSISAPNQPTNYFYNTLGKMVRVQQGVQNRYFMYDSLGRALRVKQPEQEVNTALDTTGNADNNSWTAGFSYDNNGNVLTTTDAKGTTITNTYDALNRPLTRTYSDGTPTVTNYYDDQTAPFSKGKLTKVTSNISETTYTSFDMAGRLLSSTQRTPLDGETVANAIPRTSSYVYNLSGSLTQETYPSGRVVNHEYDASGDIARISGRPTATATEQMYATGFSYFADGKIERLKLGNGLWESAKLNSRLQATEIAMGHSVGDGSLMKLNYEYGELNTDGSVDTTKNAGNIAKQTVSFSGLAHPFVQTYKYDSLDRIKEAIEKVNGVQTWKQTFGYDIYGNRNAFYQKVGSQELAMNNLTLPTVEPTSNRFAINQGYGYDKDGNITTDPANGGRSFVFNGDNKQTEVKNSSNVTIGRYYYNGEGKRVKKVTDLETTIFVYDGLGKLVAEYSTAAPPTNPTINYTATDQLGSPRVLTDKLGNVVSRRDFLPFGEEIYANSTANRTEANRYSLTGQDTVRKRFTGYEKDIETGLDFAEARYYQNQHGRFAAVDPLLASGKSANPQTFNRYVYTMNRPLVLNDPSGLQAGTSSLGYEFSVTVRSFAPFEWFGTYANIARGDNRGFSTDPSATYRIQATSQMVARNDGISHPMSITRASEATTSETNIGGLISWTAQSECYIQDPNGNYAPDGLLGGTDLISYQMSGNDDAIPGSSNINLHPNIWFNFDESQGNGVVDMTVTTSVSGDQFPAAEAFVTDTSGNSVMLGTFAPLSSNGPVFGLMTDQRLPMIDSRTTVRVNNGVFEGVVENGNVVPLDEYNGRFTQQPAVRPSP